MNPAVAAAFKTQAASFVSANPTVPLYWPNETITPPDPPAPFVWSERVGLRASVLAMGMPGSHQLQDDGFIRFHVMVPYGTGEDTLLTLAESLAALFRVTTPGNLSGLQTLAPSPPEGGAQSDDGNYFGVSFSVPYFYIYTG